jgi:xanthine dehydrogenase FAD-binding subunit
MKVNEYKMASSIEEALTTLATSPTEYRMLAGGTDVLPRFRDNLIKEVKILDLTLLKKALGFITMDETGALHIGAMATHQEIVENEIIKEHFSVLQDACRTVGSIQIKNRGTLGGNIMNASPAGDSLPVLVAADTEVILISVGGERRMLLEDFMLGPGKTTIKADEILKEIVIPKVYHVSRSNVKYEGQYRKLGGRKAMTISIASVAILKDHENKIRVAYGALSPRIKRATAVEDYVNSAVELDIDSLQQEVEKCVNPLSDVRASEEYRKKVAANLTRIILIQMRYDFKDESAEGGC